MDSINKTKIGLLIFIFSLGSIFCALGFERDFTENCYQTQFNSSTEGHNIGNAYLSILACYYSYENRINAKNFSEFKQKYKSYFQKWGFQNFDFINIRKKTGDTQAIVMSNSKMVMLVFRGSEGFSKTNFRPVKAIYDWLLTDFNFLKKRILWWGWGVKVHRGFYTALDIAYKDIKELCQKHLKNSTKKLWITGHSLGGSLATLAAFRLAEDGIKVQGAYSFASPRLGNKTFVRKFQQRFPKFQRWVFYKDLVTKLPFKWMKYAHECRPNNIYKGGKLVLSDQEFSGRGKASSHAPGNYLQHIYNLIPTIQKDYFPAPPQFRRVTDINEDQLERKIWLQELSRD